MRHVFWLVALAGGLLWGCDTLPGAPSLEGRPPVVSDLSFAPDSVDFNTLPSEQIRGDTALIPLSLAVTARDPDGRIARVAFVVRAPLNTTEPVATARWRRPARIATRARRRSGCIGRRWAPTRCWSMPWTTRSA